MGGASGAHGLPAEFVTCSASAAATPLVQVVNQAMKEIIELFSQSGQVPPSAAMGVRGQAPAPGASTGGRRSVASRRTTPAGQPGASPADVLREIMKRSASARCRPEAALALTTVAAAATTKNAMVGSMS